MNNEINAKHFTTTANPELRCLRWRQISELQNHSLDPTLLTGCTVTMIVGPDAVGNTMNALSLVVAATAGQGANRAHYSTERDPIRAVFIDRKHEDLFEMTNAVIEPHDLDDWAVGENLLLVDDANTSRERRVLDLCESASTYALLTLCRATGAEMIVFNSLSEIGLAPEHPRFRQNLDTFKTMLKALTREEVGCVLVHDTPHDVEADPIWPDLAHMVHVVIAPEANTYGEPRRNCVS
jgi:hypothetical protein